jgi:hypothetical protein
LPGLLLLFGLLGIVPVLATDYFVRPDGDDRASGRSRRVAWRTIARVNGAQFKPGDRVLFQAGKSFTGNLRLTSEDAGMSNAPVVIGSTGRGRAVILTGRSTGITVENSGGVVIENLVIQGAGRTNNTGYGIACDNTLESGERLDDLRIQNVEVSGFGMFGIWVSGERGGFSHVRITDCAMHDNLRGGMEVAGRLPYDATNYAHADVQVSRCRAFNNTGDPARLDNHSGSGMVLYQVDGGVIEHCEAWNNGAECRSKAGGGVGIWTCASRRVIIQHCESFANRTSAVDGGGFDLDGGCVECVLQYNYSHDNDGPGLMVYTYPYASHTDRGSVVRFNISENDSRRSRTYAGLWVRSDGARLTGVEVYDNTVTLGPWTDQAVMIHGREVAASIRNNLFIGTGVAIPLRVSQPHDRLRFENNLYWREGGPIQIVWGDRTFSNLREWREGTGQELVRGKPTGFAQPPALTSHASSVRAGERVGVRTLRAFRPRAASPANAGGLDLRKLFGLDVGGRDFAGAPLPSAGKLPLGAIGGQCGR